MSPQNAKPLLAGVPPNRFVGRRREVERVYAAAVTGLPARGIRLSATPGAGASELLRQVYDRLFAEQRFCVPFYFALEAGDGTSVGAASRYLYQFLLQAVAFRRSEPELLAAQPEMGELAKLAAPSDADWVNGVSEILERNGPLNNERAFVRTALAAPFRGAISGVRVFPIVDDLHDSLRMDDGRSFVDELTSVFSVLKIPYLLSAAKGFAIDAAGLEQLELSPLPREEMSEVISNQAVEADIEVSDHARDLIAVQVDSRPARSQIIIDAARDRRKKLESFRDVEQVYADELVGGRLGQLLDGRLLEAAGESTVVRKLVEALHLSLESGNDRFSIGALLERLAVDARRSARIAASLAAAGFISIEAGMVRLEEDPVVQDMIDSRYRLGKVGTTPTAVRAHLVTKAIERAPRMMEGVYRSEAAIGLEELLLSFDLQDVPVALLDYRAFRDRYKGLSEGEIGEELARDDQTVELPQISHAARLVEHLPTATFEGAERAVVGLGFRDRAYRTEDRTTWLCAEIESKLEANAQLTDTWLERLSEAASQMGLESYRIWLVSPEGFDVDAQAALEEREAFGSSRRQAELLRNFLDPEAATAGAVDVKEYEMVIPAGDDAELISAHSLEEIARRHEFPPKAVNQIKTALVEACINASEHGLSPDRKIYQRFAVDNEKIVITISNRGIRMRPASQNSDQSVAGEGTGRRGWGLELIRRLMDEVRVEQVDDGTRILMTKYLRAEQAPA